MSKILKTVGVILVCLTFVTPVPNQHTVANTVDETLTILFTHDIHSYLKPVRVAADGEEIKYQGGIARMASLIQEKRAQYGEQALVLDAGDFSMGTLFHALFDSDAPELRLMGKMGYDVVTFGNHELDFHADMLAQMLYTAKDSGERLPKIVASNFTFDQSNPRSNELQRAFQEFPVREYLVLERNGLRVGIFGLMGESAAIDTAYPKDITFENPIEAARRMVHILKYEEKVDIIIALSHSGTWEKKSASEDEILAEQVPEIDVIISGHTHTVLEEPILIGKTFIVSAGCYGAYLGVLQVDFSSSSGGELITYDLLEITENIDEQLEIARAVAEYESIIDQQFLSKQDLSAEQVIAESDFNFETLNQLFSHPGENGLGNLIADAYRYAVQDIEGEKHTYIQAAVEPLGMIRSSFVKGDISTSDIFRVLSLGTGIDGEIGVPLVSFYLTGDDIRKMLELEATVAPLVDEDAYLNVSGITFTHNPYRVPFNRVVNVTLLTEDNTQQHLDSQGLYRVVSNLWAYEALESINQETYGLVQLTARDQAGNPIINSQDIILDANPEIDGVQELKQWTALSVYLSSMPDTDGDSIPNIPARYRQPEGRNVVEPSYNLHALLIGANYITFIVLAVLFIGIVIFIIAFWVLFRIIKRIRVHQKP